jgi:Glycosyl-4,4'-diaponeurosporenoate acyltransferase
MTTQGQQQLPRAAFRYVDGLPLSLWGRLGDLWFAPKRFETTTLYEHLGVTLVKKYVPTGGDFFIRRYGIHIVNVRGNLDSLIHFERYTRRLEAIHEVAFLGFVSFSSWRAIVHQTTLLDFGFAIVVYILLILPPAMLQRYNRLRLYPLIRRLAASYVHTKHSGAG